MKEAIGLSESLKAKLRGEKREDQKNISFSQYSVYESCPHRWYQTYAKGHKMFTGSINTVFGTAIHEAIQEYLRIMYQVTIKAADEYDIVGKFEQTFKSEYLKEKLSNNGNHFSTKEEMEEFFQDGVEILTAFKKKRADHFSNKNQELLGIEVPVNVEIGDDNDTFLFNGYVDFIYKDLRDGTIYIEDFKTSTKGWSKYEKGDDIKQSQVLFYKKYFSKQFGVDIKNIVPRYRILRRKLWENSDFPQSRIQMHEPANGTAKINAAMQRMAIFISNAFNPDGSYKEKQFDKNPSPSNCRFCPFKDDDALCNKKNG